MGQKVSKIPNIPYKGQGNTFFGNSRDYYLSIGVYKSRFKALFAIFDFLGPKKVRGPTGTSMSLGPPTFLTLDPPPLWKISKKQLKKCFSKGSLNIAGKYIWL